MFFVLLYVGIVTYMLYYVVKVCVFDGTPPSKNQVGVELLIVVAGAFLLNAWAS